MPHVARVQHIRPKHRAPYFTLRINRKLHYLGTDQSVAYKRAAKLLSGVVSGDPLSVAALVVRYKQEHTDYHTDRTRHPWADYAGGVPLDEIGRDHLEKYALHLKRRKLAAATQRKYVWEAHMILTWAHRQEWVDAMPDKAKTPKPAADPQDVDVDTLHAAFAELPERAKAVLSFMLAVGCRPSEARLLRWDQVDSRRSVCILSAHKTMKATGRPRTLFLTPAAVAILKAQPRKAEYVFLSRFGKPYGQHGLRSILRRRGISKVYAMRHTAAQAWLDQGTPIEDVGKLLGHSSLQMTQRYARVRDQRAREVAGGLESPLQQPPPAGKRSKSSSSVKAKSPGKPKASRRKRATGTAA